VKIETHDRGRYKVLRIEEEFSVISDLSELKYLIEGFIEQGRLYIAVGFTNTSYIYSGAVAVLMDCYRKVKAGDGDLCIIEPNESIKSIFTLLNIDRVLRIYESEHELPTARH
jgi:anti-anti-sigma factor